MAGRHLLTIAFFCFAAGKAGAEIQNGQQRLDVLGDPLPESAIARLGTTRLRHSAGFIVGIAFSPDDGSVATADRTGTCNLWDARTGKLIRNLSSGTGPAGDLAFTDQGKTIVSTDREDKTGWWDMATGKRKDTWQPFEVLEKPGQVNRTLRLKFADRVFSDDGHFLCVGIYWQGDNPKLQDEAIVLFDLVSRKELWRTSGKDCLKSTYGFLPHRKQLLISGTTGTRICDAATGKVLQEWDSAEAKGLTSHASLAIGPDGKIATGDSEGNIDVWSVPKFTKQRSWTLRQPVGRPNIVADLAFSRDGKTLAVAVCNRLTLVDAESGREKVTWSGHNSDVDGIVFSPDGRELLTRCSADLTDVGPELLRWQTASWKLTDRAVLPHSTGALSPNFRLFTTYYGSDTRDLTDVWARKRIGGLEPPASVEAVRGWVFSPQETFIVAHIRQADSDLTAVFQCSSGKMLWQLPAAIADKPAFSADERSLTLQEHRSDVITVLESATGKIKQTIKTGSFQPKPVALSPDGRLLAVWIPERKEMQLWNVDSGKLFSGWLGSLHSYRVRLAWSPNGRTLAVSGGGDDYRIQLWEVSTGRLRRELPGHGTMVTALAWSPDGRWLASGSRDTTVLVWDVWSR